MKENQTMKSLSQYTVVVLVCIVSALAACAEPVTIQIQNDQPGRVIPTDYLGISVETGSILAGENGWHRFTPKNKSLVQLYKTVGVASLRLGGDQVDAPEYAIPTRTDIDELF